MNEYDGIEYHSDGMMREGHAAINVKVYARIALPDEHEAFAVSAWDSVRESFWEEATGVAHARGYSCVFSEGRSGGWMVPFYQRGMAEAEIRGRKLRIHLRTRAPLIHSWPGQGGALGYPQYPDMDCIGERARFRSFQREIDRMLETVPSMVRAEAAFQHEQALESFV